MRVALTGEPKGSNVELAERQRTLRLRLQSPSLLVRIIWFLYPVRCLFTRFLSYKQFMEAFPFIQHSVVFVLIYLYIFGKAPWISTYEDCNRWWYKSSKHQEYVIVHCPISGGATSSETGAFAAQIDLESATSRDHPRTSRRESGFYSRAVSNLQRQLDKGESDLFVQR